jgi:hypothetical protein
MTSQGVAHVFFRTGTTWAEQGALVASEGTAGDQLGFSVSVNGDTVVAGAPSKDGGAGAAFVFVRSGTTWAEQQELTVADGPFSDFGEAVAVWGDAAIVGAPDEGSMLGAAYLFARSGGVWGAAQQITASDGMTTDSFGQSVALTGAFAIVGTPGKANGEGAAYALHQGAANGDPCTAGDDCASTSCLDGVCCVYVVCPPIECQAAGTCQPGTGLCQGSPLPDGTACDDHNPCTQGEACHAGMCNGGSTAMDCPATACTTQGTCFPQDGSCTHPPKPDGTACDDGTACTKASSCQGGTCVGSEPVVCLPTDACHDFGSCDPTSGVCSNPAKGDGQPCPGGTCVSGVCETASGGAGGSGEGGSGGSGGSRGGGGGGCSCGVGGAPAGGWIAVLGAWLLTRRRRRCRAT